MSHFVSGVYDGSGLRLYLGGALEETGVVTGTIVSNEDDEIWIGTNGLVTQWFSGLVHEIRIWDRALTAEEVAENAETVLSGQEEGLVVYYRFDDLAVLGVARDLSGNSNHGQLMGATAWQGRYEYQGDFGGHSYYYSEYETSWTDARATAELVGGYLAVISSAEENQFVAPIATMIGDGVWIGLSDHESEGDFTWVRDEGSTYANWDSGEPSNTGTHGPEHYVELHGHGGSNGTWNDLGDASRRHFVIELPPGSGPEPELTVSQSTVTVTNEDRAFDVDIINAGAGELLQWDVDGSSHVSDTVRVVLGEAGPPESTRLLASYPNPFNSRAHLRFELSEATTVSLILFNAAGQVVRNLVKPTSMSAGRHDVAWDAADNAGRQAGPGVYVYTLQAGPRRFTGKLVLAP